MNQDAFVHVLAANQLQDEIIRKLEQRRQLQASRIQQPARFARLRVNLSTTLIAVAERIKPASGPTLDVDARAN